MKKVLTNNLGLKLLSVVAAIMLWLIVMNIDDPYTYPANIAPHQRCRIFI